MIKNYIFIFAYIINLLKKKKLTMFVNLVEKIILNVFKLSIKEKYFLKI